MSNKVVKHSSKAFRSIGWGLSIPHTTSRCFASSSLRPQEAVISFKSTSNHELDEKLQQFRQALFLPVHLNPQQRKLVYTERGQKSLKKEPVEVEIAGEKFSLEPVNITTDIPHLRKTIQMMNSPKELENLPALLEGFAFSARSTNQKWHLGSRLKTCAIRQAAFHNRLDLIIECARRVSKTGFTLNDLYTTQLLMTSIQGELVLLRSETGEWDAKATRAALKKAEIVADLLDDPGHVGGIKLEREGGSIDPRSRPEIIGILLELAVIQAEVSGTKADKQKVLLYTRRLLPCLGDDFAILPFRKLTASRLAALSIKLFSPILYGVRGASKFLDRDSPEIGQLRQKDTQITKMLEECIKEINLIEDETVRAKQQSMYQMLFSKGSSKAAA